MNATAEAAPITVRRAESADDLAAAYRLRYEVHVAELGKGAVPGADHLNRQITDPSDESTIILIAVQGDELVGTSRLVWGGLRAFTASEEARFRTPDFAAAVGTENIAIADRLVVARSARKGPAALQLIAAMMEEGAQRHVSVGMLECEPHLLRLYERLGARPHGSPFVGSYGTVLVPLAIFDRSYLARIGSPLGQMLTGEEPPEVLERLYSCLPEHPPVRSLTGNPDAYRAEFCGAAAALPEICSWIPRDDEPLLDKVMDVSSIIDLQPGQEIIIAGQPQRSLYLILDGSLEVFAGDEMIGSSSRGAFLGDVAFLIGSRRLNTVRAAGGGARLLAFGTTEIKKLLGHRPELSARFYEQLAASLATKLAERQERRGAVGA